MTDKQQRILKVTEEDFYNLTNGDEMDVTSTVIELIQKQAPSHNFEDLELAPTKIVTSENNKIYHCSYNVITDYGGTDDED
jgi:hypothetical protein